jgi:hypothetical protein
MAYTLHTLTMRKYSRRTLDAPRAAHWTAARGKMRKAEAVAAAAAHPTRASVTDSAFQVVYDNQKPPALLYDIDS